MKINIKKIAFIISIPSILTICSFNLKKDVERQVTGQEYTENKKVNSEEVTNQNVNTQIVQKQIIRNGWLDEVWDFEKLPKENGYDLWIVGLKDEEFAGVRQASDSTVVFADHNFFGMNYKSQQEYDSKNGPDKFRTVIMNAH